MTVQNNPNTIDFLGNGAQTSFAFTFRADDVSWISLSFSTDLDQILLNADQDTTPGGSVVFTVAPPLNQLIRVTRIVPQDQDLDYTRFDAFDSESHEDALDKLTMEVQDLQQKLDLFTSVPIFSIGTVDGSILRWNDAGQNWDEFITYFLPAADGAPGTHIITDGAGNLSFDPIPLAFDPAANQNITGDWIFNNPIFDLQLGVSTALKWRNPADDSTTFAQSLAGRFEWGIAGAGFNSDFMDFGNSFIYFRFGDPIFIDEQAAAIADIAGKGQWWVRNDVPNTPMFTDDAGNDFELNAVAPPPAFRGCKAFSSVGIVLPNDAAPTFPVNANEIALALNSESFDTDSIHDNAVNNTRLTVPAGVTRIILRGGATIGPAVTGLHHLRMRKNGGSGSIDTGMAIFIPHQTVPAGGSGSNKGLDSFTSGVINTVAGDYFEMYGLNQNVVAGLVAGTIWFEMEIIQ